MARIIQNNAQFNPFSFDEMLKPVALYGEAYRSQEDALAELENKSAVWDGLLDKIKDAKTYKKVKKYIDGIKAASSDLSTNGLSVGTRKALLNLKSLYGLEIAPIDVLYKKRAEIESDQRKMEAANPTIRFRRKAAETSLDDMYNNPTLDFGANFSGQMLQDDVYKAVASIKTAMLRGDKLQSIGLPFLYQLRLDKGATPDEVFTAMFQLALQGDPSTVKFLRSIVLNEVASSGVLDWNDPSAVNYAYTWANKGLMGAIGESEMKYFTDQYSMQEALAQNEWNKKLQEANAEAQRLNGNIPLNFDDLVSPLEGERVPVEIRDYENLQKLGYGYDPSKNKKAGYVRIDVGPASRNRDAAGGDYRNQSIDVNFFSKDGLLLSKKSVMSLTKNTLYKEAIARKYDEFKKWTEKHITPVNGHYPMSAYKKYYDGLYANKVEGSKMLSMVQLRLDKDTITNIILSNAQKTVNGGITGIMEVKDWNSDGSMETKGRVKLKTLQNELSKEDVQPLLYVPGTAATRGVIVKLGKKTYLIPQNVLGSIGAEAFNIDVPMLQTAYQTKQDLISRYGEDAYYKSPEGQKLEATIDLAGAAYVRSITNALAFEYKLNPYQLNTTTENSLL